MSVSGDTVVVGASGERSDATGVNGNQGDNSAPGAGAAYVFDNCEGITNYGTGCAGSGGFVPSLDLVGCAIPGGYIRIDVAHGLGGASSFLVVGSGQASTPVGGGCKFLLQPPFVLFGPLALNGVGPGDGSVSTDSFVNPSIPAGAIGTLQVFVVDPGNAIGYAASNGVEMVIQ